MKTSITSFVVALLGLLSVVAVLRHQNSPHRLLQTTATTTTTSTSLQEQLCSSTPNKNVTNSTLYDIASTVTTNFQNYRGGGSNQLLTLVQAYNNGGDTGGAASTYAQSLIFPAVIWAVGLVFILIGFLVCCLCCCCDCCNCCQCRKYTENPLLPAELTKWGIVYAVVAVIETAFIITALVYSTTFSGGAQGVACGLGTIVDDVTNGVTYTLQNGTVTRWIGLNQADANLATLGQQVIDAANNISGTVSGSTTTITNDYNSMVSQINSMYTSNQNSKLNNPDPTSTDGSTVTTPIIQSLGPSSNTSTIAGAVKYELDTLYNLVNNAFNTISSYSSQLKTQAQTIKGYIDSTYNTFHSIQQNVVSVRDTLYDNAPTIGSSISGMGSGITGALGALLGLLFVGALFFVLYKMCNCTIMCLFFYILWIIFSIITLVCFLGGLAFTPISQIAIDACPLVYGLLNGTLPLSTFGAISTENSAYLQVCLTGDGNILSAFTFASQINDLQNYTAYLSTMTELQSNLTNTSIPDSYVIPPIQSFINGVILGYYPGFSTDTNNVQNDRAVKAVAALNLWADYSQSNNLQQSAGSCSVSQDFWYLNSDNCTSSSGRTTVPASTPSSNFGSKSCLGMYQWENTTSSNRYSSSSYSSCKATSALPTTSVSGNINAYITSLQSYMSSVSTVFWPIANSLSDQLAARKSFRADLLTVVNSLATIGNQVTTLVNTVSNTQHTGLLDQVNCAFIGGDLTYMFQNLCGTFMPALYTLAWLAGVVGVFGLFLVMALYCLAIKTMRVRNGRGGNPEGGPGAPGEQAKINPEQSAISPETAGMVNYGGGYQSPPQQ